MQKATLKISALVLCGLLIYNSLGYFMVVSIMRISVRHQKWAQLSTIPDQQLTRFVFTKNKPNARLKHVNEREIMVDGNLYDIARKVDDGSNITYYCVHDRKEQNLIAKTRLFNTMAQPAPVKNTARLIIEKIIKTADFNHQTEKIIPDYIQLYTFITKLIYSGPVISILLPPPQSYC
jgi:hypothetical protein